MRARSERGTARVLAGALTALLLAGGASAAWWSSGEKGEGVALLSSTGGHETVVRELSGGDRVALSGGDHALRIQWSDSGEETWTAPTTLWADGDTTLHDMRLWVVGGALAVPQVLVTDTPAVEPWQEFPSHTWWCLDRTCEQRGFTQLSTDRQHAWSFDEDRRVSVWSPSEGASTWQFRDRLEATSLVVHAGGTVTTLDYRGRAPGPCRLTLAVREPGEQKLSDVATTGAFRVRGGDRCEGFRAWDDYRPVDGAPRRIVVHGQGSRSAVFTREDDGRWRASWENTGETAR